MRNEEWREVANMLRRAAQIVRPKSAGNVAEIGGDQWPYMYAEERRLEMAERYLDFANEIDKQWPDMTRHSRGAGIEVVEVGNG